MPNGRIYLGVDINSNLAISLEPVRKGEYSLIVSTGDCNEDLCGFVCSEEALESILQSKPLTVTASLGHCVIQPVGDEIVVEFQLADDSDPTKCTLSSGSFSRVLRLAKNRAYCA